MNQYASLRVPMALVFFILIALPLALGVRLPVVGEDSNSWGQVLNEFLNISLTENGTLRSGTVGTEQIVDGAINANKIAERSIGGSHLQEHTVTAAEIALNTITSEHISEQSITADDIARGGIEASNIADEAIGSSSKLADNIITSDKIEDGTITGNDIGSTSELNVESITASYGTLNVVSATEINAEIFGLGIQEISDACLTSQCTASIECPGGKTIVFGLRSTTSSICDSSPEGCNGYCTPGSTTCSATAVGSDASVYVVCARVA
jgi:hypothetical protein